ncbi:hypothetical protein TNCV_559221 [Trichonephila clavipes]|nr:hypothetical protein TNCV_559221 [Trichonephila clavipes]
MKEDSWKNRETYNTNTEEYRIFITIDDPSTEQKEYSDFHSKRESNSGESPTSVPEDTSKQGIRTQAHSVTGRGSYLPYWLDG